MPAYQAVTHGLKHTYILVRNLSGVQKQVPKKKQLTAKHEMMHSIVGGKTTNVLGIHLLRLTARRDEITCGYLITYKKI